MAFLDKNEARKNFDKKDYKGALLLYEKLIKYFINDPEMFLLKGFCHMNLGDQSKACDDLNYSIFLAEEYGYPESMNLEKVKEFIGQYCGVVEKENVEEK